MDYGGGIVRLTWLFRSTQISTQESLYPMLYRHIVDYCILMSCDKLRNIAIIVSLKVSLKYNIVFKYGSDHS